MSQAGRRRLRGDSRSPPAQAPRRYPPGEDRSTARSSRQQAVSADEPLPEWLSLAQARAILGVASEDVVRYWAERLDLLRSRVLPTGEPQARCEDVLEEQRAREELGAIDDFALTAAELDALEAGRPGTAPWKREKNARPAA